MGRKPRISDAAKTVFGGVLHGFKLYREVQGGKERIFFEILECMDKTAATHELIAAGLLKVCPVCPTAVILTAKGKEYLDRKVTLDGEGNLDA